MQRMTSAPGSDAIFDTDLLRSTTRRDAIEDTEGVQVSHLPPGTTLLIQTMNSLYRVVITNWPEVYVQGGALFPHPTSAYFDGASIGGSGLRVGWIGVGLPVEIRAEGRRIITSRVRAITAEQASSACTHRTEILLSESNEMTIKETP